MSKPEPLELEHELAQLIRQSAPDIVKKVIAKAQEGSYQHAKFLFDLAGLDLRGGGEDGDENDNESLAAFLRRELQAPTEGPAPG